MRQTTNQHGGHDAERMGHPAGARDQRQADAGQPTGALPGVQPAPSQKDRPVLVGHLQAGRGAVALLALWVRGRGLV